MRSNIKLVTLILILVFCSWARGKEMHLDSRVVSVGLFKNGYGVIHRLVEVPGPGTYYIDDVPKPVHGTLWLESDAVVGARTATREIEEALWEGGKINLQKSLVGKEVVIHFTDGRIPPVSGTVEDLTGTGEENDREGNDPLPSYRLNPAGRNAHPPQQEFLILKTEEGLIMLKPSLIAYLQVTGNTIKVSRPKPVLLFDVKEGRDGSKGPAKILLTYLTRGIAWAPSYRVDITDPETLKIEQKAVIRNELADLVEAEAYLISGFPSIQFSHVTSPLFPGTNWGAFFRELSSRPGSQGQWGSQVVTQQVLSNVYRPAETAPDLSAMPTGEGVDLHYHPVGTITLAEGESLITFITSARAQYSRIVEWIVPDTRTWNGRFITEYQRNQDPEKYKDAAWDAVRFKNPFAFPMTTAPVMVVAKNRFNGQRTSFWSNPEEETTVHITKALSVRTLSTEREEEGKRKVVYIGTKDYRKATVIGSLRMSNHRKESVSLVIRRRFSGDFIEADESPTCTLREEGVYSVNKRNELVWKITLEPGEEKTLTYRYSVLIDI